MFTSDLEVSGEAQYFAPTAVQRPAQVSHYAEPSLRIEPHSAMDGFDVASGPEEDQLQRRHGLRTLNKLRRTLLERKQAAQSPHRSHFRSHRRSDARMEFGKGFGSYYSGWADFVKEYPQEDRDAYPALFELPEDCYEIKLNKPLGIAFVEGDNARVGQPDGVKVDYLVEGGNAEKDGTIKPGDTLLATTACMGRDGTFERKVIPSRYLDFDTIMSAIGSNEPKFNKERKNDVILQFCRPGARYENEGDPYDGGKRGIADYLDSLKFPVDSPWLGR